MSRFIRRILASVFAAAVAAALSFGAVEAVSSPSPASACDDFGQLGSCPPFDNTSCDQACFEEFGTGGACAPDDCCTCMV